MMGAWALMCVTAMLGCEPSPEHLEWSVGFVSGDLEEETAAVTAWIIRGGCNGNRYVYESRVGASASERPSLRPGRYGIGATARAADCSAVAEACLDVRMPRDADVPIRLTLVEARAVAPCESGRCVDGECQAPSGSGADLGLVDLGGVDVGASDQGAVDLGDGDSGTPPEDAGSDDCPSGVRRDGGHCYRYFAQTEKFSGAESLCAGWGGRVVVFDDDAEESWVVSNASPTTDFWLGLTDTQTEGVWLTVYGDAPTYEHWDPSDSNNQPNDCAGYALTAALWHYVHCNGSTRAVVCERP